VRPLRQSCVALAHVESKAYLLRLISPGSWRLAGALWRSSAWRGGGRANRPRTALVHLKAKGANVDEILARAAESSRGLEPSGRSPALTKHCNPSTSRADTPVSRGGRTRVIGCTINHFRQGQDRPPVTGRQRKSADQSWGPAPTCSVQLSIFDPGPRTSSATTITEVRGGVDGSRSALAWPGSPIVLPRLPSSYDGCCPRAGPPGCAAPTTTSPTSFSHRTCPGRVAKQLLQLAHAVRAPREGGAMRVTTHDLTCQE